MIGRAKPYTEAGIRRIPCVRCGVKAEHQWQICATGNRYAGICVRCDVALNAVVLQFMRVPGSAEMMRAYSKRQQVMLPLLIPPHRGEEVSRLWVFEDGRVGSRKRAAA